MLYLRKPVGCGLDSNHDGSIQSWESRSRCRIVGAVVMFGEVHADCDSVSIFGLLYQSLGLALCAPFYLLAHSLTSPTATMPTIQNIAIPKPALSSLMPAMVLGMILPTLSMSLPSPAYVSHHTKANLVLLWQFFPVWTSLFCLVFVQIFRFVSASLPTLTNSQSHLLFCHNAIRSDACFCAHSGRDTHAGTLDFQSQLCEAAHGSLPRISALANPVYSRSFKHSGRSTLVHTVRLYYHKLGFSLLERVVETCKRGKGKQFVGFADCTSLCICPGKDCDPGSDRVCGVLGVGARRGHIGIC